MSIQPVQAFEPPYVMAVFSNVRTPDESGYPETNARMNELVAENPGFLGYESARTPEASGSPSPTSATTSPWACGGRTWSTRRR